MEKIQNVQRTHKHKISEENVKQYVFERFNDVKVSSKIKNLVNFQAMNKYMIMVHSQEELKRLGSIVANHKKKTASEIFDEYEKHLKNALEHKPTIKKHTNVIMHIFGYFSKHFIQNEKIMFFKLVDDFKKEKTTVGNILAEINPIIFRLNNIYLASQTYFLLYSDTQPEFFFTDKKYK